MGPEPAAVLLGGGAQVSRELRKKIVRAWEEVIDVHRQRQIDLRKAAYIIAIDRVARAERLRGFE